MLIRKSKIFFILFSILILIPFSCKQKQDENFGKTLIASVLDKNLYYEDIKDEFSGFNSEEDSLIKIQYYIDSWVSNQLLLKEAEKYFENDLSEINKKVEDYRTTLLIFKFKEEFLKQKLDTIISFEEINNYYNEHKTEFVLNKYAVKGFYFIIKKDNPELRMIKNLLYSNNPANFSEIENLCVKYAEKYNNFNSDWTYLSDILIQIPVSFTDIEFFLQTSRYYETTDENYYYYFRIFDYLLPGEIGPVILFKSDIHSILLNIRSAQGIEDLEKQIMNNAIQNNEVIIYN